MNQKRPPTRKTKPVRKTAQKPAPQKPDKWAILTALGILVFFVVISVIVSSMRKPDYIERPKEITTAQPEGADVAGFERDCITAVLETKVVADQCKSTAQIKAAYNVDVQTYLNEEKGPMITTARHMARGDVFVKDEYKACIKNHDCIRLPFIEGKEPDWALFNHLVKSGRLNKAMCRYLRGCQAMVYSGVLILDE